MKRILDPKAKDFDREFFDRLYSEYKEGTKPLVERMVREVKQKEQEKIDLERIAHIINKVCEHSPYLFGGLFKKTKKPFTQDWERWERLEFSHALYCIHKDHGLDLKQMEKDSDYYEVIQVSDDLFKVAMCFNREKEKLECDLNELNYLK